MLNNFERPSAIPDEETIRLSNDNPDHNLTSDQNSNHHDSESIGESDCLPMPGRSKLKQSKTEGFEDSVQERTFEHTREGNERRTAALDQLERKIHQLREDFAKQYAQDQAREVEEYFASDISEAENGGQVKELLHQIVVEKVMAGIANFIETGNQESIPPLFIQLQKATYPLREGTRHFLVEIAIDSGVKGAVKEHLDLRSQHFSETHPKGG